MKKDFAPKGFTLIELMITVAIVGILAGIAYPSYMKSVQKSNRADAKAELTDVAQRLQRCYTIYGKFNDANCEVYSKITGSSTITSRGSAYYSISMDALPSGASASTAYVLKATAIKSPQTKDTANGCNNLTLDQTGQKLPVACW